MHISNNTASVDLTDPNKNQSSALGDGAQMAAPADIRNDLGVDTAAVTQAQDASVPGNSVTVDPGAQQGAGNDDACGQSTAECVGNPIITVVRDPEHTLGKQFTLTGDGTLSKKSAVSVAVGVAIMHRVDTHQELAALLNTVGADTNAAIINASFDDIAVGEEFLILSEREIEQRLGIPRSDRTRQRGVHLVSEEGKQYKGVGRFKENVRPSSWQYFDRDVDQHTPEQFAIMSDEEWLVALGTIFPALRDVAYLRSPSSSSRVIVNGQSAGHGNGHLWVKVRDADDIERFRAASIVVAAQAGVTWLKPRHSRTEPDKVIGQSLTTIFDPSVWTPGRLVFDGKPVGGTGVTVQPPSVSVHSGVTAEFDTATVALPEPHVVREITRTAGVEMNVQRDGNGLRITMQDLLLDTEIETEDHKILTVREIVQRGEVEKVRCQTPFRASTSHAAFLSFGADGKPFVFDVGTGITHWLSDFEAEGLQVAQANGVVSQLLARLKLDPSAALEAESVKALAIIRQHDAADFQRVRANLKQANSKVLLGALDGAVKAQAKQLGTAPTHHGYAKKLLAGLMVGEWKPVAHEGSLFVVDPASNIWRRREIDDLIRSVAETFDDQENCSRTNDYRNIAQHAISIAGSETFFPDAPIGLACPGGFYRIQGNDIIVEPLTPAHRQRVKLEISPTPMATPLFDTFLHETFQSPREGEEAEQCALLQEIAGAIMVGVMHRHQKAAMFYDPIGRAGKGTADRIFRGLVPPSFVTAVSPFKWDEDYHVVTLAGARLNVVGELTDDKPIPASAFKTVIGGDLVSGRHPTHRPVTFRNEAAHLFMSNHLINTKDHSEAFFTRWLILEFPNSLLRSGKPIDPTLAERIIATEMPGIAHWALEGAARLMRNGAFSKSAAHDRLMAKWRQAASSLEEFIQECCQTGDEKFTVKRSEFYRRYTDWCKDAGRRPFSRATVKDLITNNLKLGRFVELDGYDSFRGLQIKHASEDASADSAKTPTDAAYWNALGKKIHSRNSDNSHCANSAATAPTTIPESTAADQIAGEQTEGGSAAQQTPDF